MRRVFIAMMMMLTSCACALELPDSVNDWQCVSEHVVPLVLEADGESLGRMVYRDYVSESTRGVVSVILTEGLGTGSLYVPERVRASKGVMPSGSEYKIIDVSGGKAIMESLSYMPLALAVSIAEDVILTIESSSLTEDELIIFAEETLRADN